MRSLVLSLLLAYVGPTFAQDVLPSEPPPPAQAVPMETPIKREPARIPSAAEAEEMQEEGHRRSHWGFFIGVDANLGANISFNNASVTESGVSYTGNLTMNTSVAAAARIGVDYMPRYSLGFQGSVAVETPRNVSGINSNISNVSNLTVNSGATMQFNLIEADLVYRFDWLYGLIGANYAIPVGSNFGSTYYSYSFSGNVGAQGGVGFVVYGGLHLEALVYLIDMQMTSNVTAPGFQYSVSSGTGNLVSGELRAHWTF